MNITMAMRRELAQIVKEIKELEGDKESPLKRAFLNIDDRIAELQKRGRDIAIYRNEREFNLLVAVGILPPGEFHIIEVADDSGVGSFMPSGFKSLVFGETQKSKMIREGLGHPFDYHTDTDE